MKRIHKYTIGTANQSLQDHKVDSFLNVTKIDKGIVTLYDHEFGPYLINVQSLSPSMTVPLHRKRKHITKLMEARKKYIGQVVGELTITGVFFGPDRGYKNRSFYVEYTCTCGKSNVTTYAHLSRYRKNFKCFSCSATIHGERAKDTRGILGKPSSTYLSWVKYKDNLPEKYKDFEYFRTYIGDKPFRRATIELIDGVPKWINLKITQDEELNLIATSIRQVFRHSTLYKSCIEAARIETSEGTRYKCAQCSGLFKRKEVQVDHIIPIASIDGTGLTKENVIDRIWTTGIQILHKKCHYEKSTQERTMRRKIKKERI